MSIYVYNLQFSVANAQNGMFTPYSASQSGLGYSSAWLFYNGTGTQPEVTDYPSVMTALNASQWSLVPAQNQNALPLNSVQSGIHPTDFVMVRIFPLETLTNPSVRMTTVLGRGTNGQVSSTNMAQSPFLMGSNARPVIDFDNQPPGNPNWIAPGTDGAWTFCLGGVHGSGNDYSTNVGASVYVPAGQPYSGIYTFGHDPQLHVVLMPAAVAAA